MNFLIFHTWDSRHIGWMNPIRVHITQTWKLDVPSSIFRILGNFPIELKVTEGHFWSPFLNHHFWAESPTLKKKSPKNSLLWHASKCHKVSNGRRHQSTGHFWPIKSRVRSKNQTCVKFRMLVSALKRGEVPAVFTSLQQKFPLSCRQSAFTI